MFERNGRGSGPRPGPEASSGVEPIGVKPRAPGQKKLRPFYAFALVKHDGEYVAIKLTCKGKEIQREEVLDHDVSPRPPRSALLRCFDGLFFQGDLILPEDK